MADKDTGAGKATLTAKDIPGFFKGKVGQVANAAAEVAGVTALGKVAEAYGKMEVASDDQLGATEKGYFEAMSKLAEKAESREERDSYKDDLNKARESSHANAKEKAEKRSWQVREIMAGIAFLATGMVVVTKMFKRS
jgi:hypothetical protein